MISAMILSMTLPKIFSSAMMRFASLEPQIRSIVVPALGYVIVPGGVIGLVLIPSSSPLMHKRLRKSGTQKVVST
jgi:hypothetical protein